MGRTATLLQSSFSAGELDPLLAERVDVAQYYAGAEKLRNVVPLPQGGARRRPGTKFIAETINNITGFEVPNSITTPRGGTGANANDIQRLSLLTTTTGISTINPYVVVQYDMTGGGSNIYEFVDVLDMLVIGVSAAAEFVVESSLDAAAWTKWGDLPTLSDDIAVTRRFVNPTGVLAARYFRLARVGSTDFLGATISISEFNVYNTASTPPNRARVIPFQFSTTQRYKLILTPFNLRVYKDDAYQADIPVPYPDTALRAVSWVQSLDTLIIFHENYAMLRVLREGSDTAWGSYEIRSDYPPTKNFDETFSMNVTLAAALGNAPVEVDLVTGHGDATAGAAIFQAFHVGRWLYAGGGVFKIVSVTSSLIATLSVVVPAEMTGTAINGFEWSIEQDAWSDTRGWPRCGTFHEGRLYVAGSKDLPSSIWGSQSGNFFNWNKGTNAADDAIDVTLDTDDVASIYNLLSGRNLQVFTESGEFYFQQGVGEPISPDPNVGTLSIKRTTQHGSTGPGVPVVSVAGATLFIDRSKKALREFLFTDLEQAYSAENIALLAGHLFNVPFDAAVRTAVDTDEGDWVLIANDDETNSNLEGGWLTVLVTDRGQKITAWCRWDIGGRICAVGVSGAEIWIVARRVIGGVTKMIIERFDENHLLDSSLRVIDTSPSQVTQITGLTHLANETGVPVVKDGIDGATDTVDANGLCDFSTVPAEDSAEAGVVWPDVTGSGDYLWIKDMPAEPNLPDGTKMGGLKRVVEVVLSLFETRHAYVAANDEAPFQLDLNDVLTTKRHIVKGFLGYTLTGQAEVTQRQHEAFTLRAISKKVSV